ncbi:MAG: hypothetical protein HS127_03980 [Planctomycetia bacterium]|nr:hypothetical protein [Planctomycetia bacterium]
MFTSHFSMTTQPFSERINTSLIMKDERFTQGTHATQYLLHSGSIAVLYGQTGSRKIHTPQTLPLTNPQTCFSPSTSIYPPKIIQPSLLNRLPAR